MSFVHLADVLDEVEGLASRFADAGFDIYLVGGIVRDQMLDRPLERETDIDLTTDARPDDIKAAISGWADAVWDQGERFGTVGCSAGARHYEITTHRSEFYQPDSRKPAVAFSDDIVIDLSRRDFTVNAMALKLPGGELVDPHGGQADLDDHRLRTPLEANESFGDDPLRMLRAARFVSGYDLRPTDDVRTSMTALASRLEIVSVERRRDELDKLVMLPNPSGGLSLLAETGVARYALPTAADLGTVGSRLTALPARLPLRVAALLVDEPAAAERRLAELRFSNDQRRAVLRIIGGAVMAPTVETSADASVRRFGFEAGAHAEDALLLAAQLNDEATTDLSRRWSELDAVEDLANLEPPLDGRQIMELLGLTEGRQVGEALSHLLEIRIEEGPMTTAAATARLREWWDAQPRNSSTS